MTQQETYASSTVKDLKEELKKRGIPSTGLTRKQQIIDRLLQHDSETVQENEKEGEEPSTGEPDAALTTTEEVAQENGTQKSETEGNVDIYNEEGPKAQTPSPTAEEATIEQIPAPEDVPTSPVGSSSDREEARKRKRRSLTPAVDEAEIQKKLRHDEPPEDKEAEIVAEAPIAIGEPDTTINLGAGISEAETIGSIGTTAAPTATAEELPDSLGPEETARNAPEPQDTKITSLPSPPTGGTLAGAKQNDENEVIPYMKPSLPAPEPSDTQAKLPSAPGPIAQEAEPKDVSIIAPDRHPPTRALYIRDLMRPLQPADLEEHLITLAGESDILEDFHLDAIRTHAFVALKTLSAAAKVRSSMNGRIWPEERGRKPLQVDFIPEAKARDFIEQELRAAGGDRAASRGKRWEVVYTKALDGSIDVSLQENGSSVATSTARGLNRAPTDMNIPTGPRSMMQKRSEPRRESAPASQKKPESSQFLALDKLFKSTIAKPKLYFLPVSEELASSRILQLRAGKESTTKPNEQQEKLRYTWEDGKLVNDGPEWGLRPNRGRRGGLRRGGHNGHGAQDLYRPKDDYRSRRS